MWDVVHLWSGTTKARAKQMLRKTILTEEHMLWFAVMSITLWELSYEVFLYRPWGNSLLLKVADDSHSTISSA